VVIWEVYLCTLCLLVNVSGVARSRQVYMKLIVEALLICLHT
jgi:hypothetical protein